MDWFEDEIQEIERRPRVEGERPVVFYGSSSIRFWDTDEHFPGAGVVNLGFGGSTLAACDHFFSRAVAPFRPRSLLIYAGDNDLGEGRSPDDVLASLRRLLRQVEALPDPVRLAFLAIKPSPAREYLDGAIRRSNELARAELPAAPDRRFIDVHPRMLDASGGLRPELYVGDGLHLSRAGYRLWTEVVMEYSDFLFRDDTER